MSAENIIRIWKAKDGKFYGYLRCASKNIPKRKPQYAPDFIAKNLKEAIGLSELAEYGYTFVNLKNVAQEMKASNKDY